MSTLYRIVIRGCPADRHLDQYRDEFTISHTATCTVLKGKIVDASQLHGIVSYLTKVGLELVEITSSDLHESDV